jgi:hypothetical protein
LNRKLVLFYRDFQRFTGGHLKVWNYFQHVAASANHGPRVAFSPTSRWDETNPWSAMPETRMDWDPARADLLFLGGTDWRALKDHTFEKPIINLIQHPRHAEPGSELRRFLRNRAVRICVSEEVAEAINATGEVNGPVFVIPNAVDLGDVPEPAFLDQRKIDIFISGLKAPDLAHKVRDALADKAFTVECITEWMPRPEYFRHLNNARVTVFLPRAEEGFYLPALEGMAAGTVVVCPDCVGNRSFCRDRVNCFRPQHDVDKIVVATKAALAQSEAGRAAMLERAAATVRAHSLEHERKRFLEILGQIDTL